ncbi:hypothetical protein VTN77DRAFT_6739 [Rasamsonia byssochlamydoides]|uniref:uncharacterized protein n=1 Tax=Rasamsonia byssochlamydoides TaxID=89139 RepID=UPI00374229D6
MEKATATAAPAGTCPAFLPAGITQIKDQISFTPPATRKAPPRPWERIPSTPFLARHKSRKIWKRFRTSMQALRGQIGRGSIEEKELVKEINTSANADFLRGVKRLCLGIKGPDSQLGRGRSFLETKWELETGKRKRKLAAIAADEDSSAMWESEQEQLPGTGHESELSCGGEESQELANTEEDQHVMTPEAKTKATTDDVNNSAEAGRDSNSPSSCDLVDPAVEVDSDEAADIQTQDLIATKESEPTLVRSALRMNSLDGEEAAFLSEFLSRAQAKRAAKLAQDEERVMKGELVPNSPLVRSRRALEELDKNSPSPQKPHSSSPSKAEKSSDSPIEPMKDETDEETGNQASPAACRRSNRIRLPSLQQRAPRPAVPNQIPLRRAKGTEFVFLQRTEAQELALTTRRNTRHNKGDAQLPKYALQAMAKRQQEEDTASSHLDNSDASTRRSERKRAGAKQVSWKEEQLVEYAENSSSKDPVSGGSDKKKTASARRNGKSTKETSPGALPATPPRRVRRLALPAATNTTTTSTSGTNTNSATTSSSTKPIAVGTPIPKRKKLTPKSPSAGLLKRPAKGAMSKTVNSSSSSTTTTSSKTSNIPTSNGKSRTLLKAGPAGATPMPKRVRAKNVA